MSAKVNFQESYSDLIGLPYQLGASGNAFDCWTLVIEVLKRCGVSVDYQPKYSQNHIDQMKTYSGEWIDSEPKAGSIVLMAEKNRLHCGIMLDTASVLHCSINQGVSVVKLYNLKKQYSEMRFYRHV